MGKVAWQKVFKLAVAEAKAIRAKNPNLSYPQAMKKAWKTKKILDAKAAYKKKYPPTTAKKPVKRKPAKRKPAKRKPAKKRVVRRKKR